MTNGLTLCCIVRITCQIQNIKKRESSLCDMFCIITARIPKGYEKLMFSQVYVQDGYPPPPARTGWGTPWPGQDGVPPWQGQVGYLSPARSGWSISLG